MISQRMQIEEIRNVYVLHAKRIQISIVRFAASGVVVYFNSLNLYRTYVLL